MKKILAVIVLLLIIGGSMPFINGVLMEKTVRRAVENLNERYAETGMDYSLEILTYERHFFTSDIEWKLHFGSLQAIYGIDEMILSDHAKHGYTGVISTTSLDKNTWFTDFINEKLQGKNPFTLTTRYALLGDIESTFIFDPFTITIDDKNLAIKAGQINSTADKELKHFTSTVRWQGFSAADAIEMGEISGKADMNMHSTFLWDGTMDLNIAHFKGSGQQDSIEWSNMKGVYSLDLDTGNKTLSLGTQLAIDSLETANRHIDGVTGRFAMNNLDVQGYEDFMQVYTKMAAEMISNLAEAQNDPEKAKEIMANQMSDLSIKLVAAYEKLLKKGLELQASNVLVKMPEGDLRADITLRLLKDMTLMQFAPIVGQPALALDILYLKSDIHLPTGLVGQPPLLLEPSYPGMQTGIFVVEGDTLSHSAETREGKLYLNGKEFALAKAQ